MTIPLTTETKQQAIQRCKDRVQACIVARGEAYARYCEKQDHRSHMRFDSATRDLIEAKAKLERIVKLYRQD